MNRVFLSVVLVVVVLGAGLFLLSKNAGAPSAAQSSVPAASSAAPVPSALTLKDLLGLRTSETCTFTDSLNGSQVTGNVYVSNGKVREDINMMVNGAEAQSHILITSANGYLWTSKSSTQGLKFGAPSVTQSSANGTTPAGIDYNHQVNYSCVPQNIDDNMFTPPAGMTFIDFTTAFGNALFKHK